MRAEILDVDARLLGDRMARLVKVTGIESKQLVRGYSRLVAENVLRFSYPRKQAEGVYAVRRDFHRANKVLWAEDFQGDTKFDKRVRRLMEKGDRQGLAQLLSKARGRPHEVVPFTKNIHKNRRKSRGRVRRDYDTFVLEAGAWLSRRKQLENRVGYYKSGMVPAIVGLGGRQPVGWVSRHRRGSRGYLQVITEKGNPVVMFGALFPEDFQASSALRVAMARVSKNLRGTINGLMKGHAADYINGVVRVHRPRIKKL